MLMIVYVRCSWISWHNGQLLPTPFYEVVWNLDHRFDLDKIINERNIFEVLLIYLLFLLRNEDIIILQPSKKKKCHFYCQNVIQKFPPFVLSLPTSADDVKNVKIS